MRGTGIQINNNYELEIKVRRDKDGIIVSGLSIGDTTYQNQALILICQKGELKSSPLTGVGINDICNDNQFTLWKREIIEQLEADGQTIYKLQLDSKGMKLDAKYVSN
ncbi:MAG: hypothetical protein LBG80_04705 [Bacteroidales bacterium]|jgi:hypothetical protein|nr:hypothetical protein [Bacteroidales bacterium]